MTSGVGSGDDPDDDQPEREEGVDEADGPGGQSAREELPGARGQGVAGNDNEQARQHHQGRPGSRCQVRHQGQPHRRHDEGTEERQQPFERLSGSSDHQYAHQQPE